MSVTALSEEQIDHILEKVYTAKGWDFRRYRRSSLKRCLERRISISRRSYHTYVELLDSEPVEFNHLFNHITIKVSEFFRNPEVFRHIEDYVIPMTLRRLTVTGSTDLRIWSCGCANGEEPLSIANSLKNVDQYMRNQSFQAYNSAFQIIPQIRNLVTFGTHDIVSHIQLSHMDIILCRNLLIYFEKELQEKVFDKFYYSLKPGGFMVLGKSEVPPVRFRDNLIEVCKREKIYQKGT